jgi:protein ImuA
MSESTSTLAALKRHIASIERRKAARVSNLFTLGLDMVDTQLEGGLEAGRLHEIFAAEIADGSSAAGFTLMLAMRAAGNGHPILWLRQQKAEALTGQLHAPGLAEIGLDPARLILGVAPDESSLLKAAADSVRCIGLGAVVIEPWREICRLDLTASRRLALAAEQSGVTALLLRTDADPVPSAAQTRWRVRAIASAMLAANAPGSPAFEIELLRHRGGPDGLSWRLEWDRDQCSFQEPAFSGAVLPLPSDRPDSARARAA